jgi:hypothetical protein
VGICCETGDPNFGVAIQLSGQFCLNDWTLVTATAQLAPRTTYYLSNVPGMLTPVVPVGPAVAQRIGYSISPNVLAINMDFPGGGTVTASPSVAPAWFFGNCCGC